MEWLEWTHVQIRGGGLREKKWVAKVSTDFARIILNSFWLNSDGNSKCRSAQRAQRWRSGILANGIWAEEMALVGHLFWGIDNRIIENRNQIPLPNSNAESQVSQHVCPPQSVSRTIRRSLRVKLEELLSGTVRYDSDWRICFWTIPEGAVRLSANSPNCRCIHILWSFRAERVMCYFLEPESGLAVLSEKEFTIQVFCFVLNRSRWTASLCMSCRFGLDGVKELVLFLNRMRTRVTCCRLWFLLWNRWSTKFSGADQLGLLWCIKVHNQCFF